MRFIKYRTQARAVLAVCGRHSELQPLTRMVGGVSIRDGTFARRGDALGPKGGLMFNGQSVEEEGGPIGPRLALHAAAAVSLRRKRIGTRKHRPSCNIEPSE